MIFTARTRRTLGRSTAKLLAMTCLALLTIGASAAGASSRHAHSTAHACSSEAIATAARTLPRPLSAASKRAKQADRVLVSRAKALKRCLSIHRAHPKRCNATRHAVQRAGSRLASAEKGLARIARTTGKAASSPNKGSDSSRIAPKLTVSGETLKWSQVAHIGTYVLSRKVPGQADQYTVVNGTSITPPPVPGVTVRYSVRTTASGSAWSSEQPITYAPVETVDAQSAPAITVSGKTLNWNAIATVNTYVLATQVPGEAEQYSVVSGTSTTPPAVPGATVRYSVRTAVDGSAWSAEVSISYPAATLPPAPAPPPPVTTEPSGVIIGTNDALGWGPEVAHKILAAGLTSARVGGGPGINNVQRAREEGFTNNLDIIGNTPDDARLATVNTASWTQATLAEVKEAVANGDTLVEVGNEMYLKGGSPHGATNAAEPAKYAEMYMSLANAVDAAGIKGVKLLFNSFGNYVRSDGAWSEVAKGGGWIADALAAQPGLKARVDGFTGHPYGLAGENQEDDWGPGAMEVQHNQAVALGFVNTEYYVSEFGVEVEAGGVTGSNSPAQQAERVKAVYTELISLSYIKGIWIYESHDEDAANKWGFVSGSWTPRPLLGVLEAFAKEEGQ